MNTAVLLMGPTASGKTGMVIEWIKKGYPIEIVSVDSALVYKGMNIGTAKPDSQTLEIAPHRLIDIRDPRESYSVADFRMDALQAVDEICNKGHIPVLAGGTMLYYRSLTHGLSNIPATQPEIRAQVSAQAEKIGWKAMHELLQAVDEKAASRIHPNDPQRIQRAIEVFQQTGKNLSTWQENKGEPLPVKTVTYILSPHDRSELHQRIAKRLDIMFEQGFVDEVEQLMKLDGLTSDHSSMRSVGYRQVWSYLKGEISLHEAKMKSLYATRQLAKRQFTWLRKEQDALWAESGDEISRNFEQIFKL
ncbi:MAG: tRNA (adenosine(37)-N6)-dimethylallyltransferase MiaA [bacterium]